MTAAADSTTKWVCLPCGQQFKSKANLACHFYKKHQRVAARRLYQGDVVCPCCLKDYVDIHRMQMHLKKNPKCYRYVVSKGLCGGTAGPGIGSRAWKECRAKHPIVCPPLHVEVAEVQTALHPGHSGSPVQREIDGVAGAIGATAEDCVSAGSLDTFLEAVTGVLRKFALFPEEYGQAVTQAMDDIVLCREGAVILWSDDDYKEVIRQLEELQQLVCGSWLADAAMVADAQTDRCRHLHVSHVPVVRAAIMASSKPILRSFFRVGGADTVERTHAAYLLGKLPCAFQADYIGPASCKSDLVIHTCFAKGEAAACQAGESGKPHEGSASSAALDGCLIGTLEQGRHLRRLLLAWKECWRTLLSGFGVGIACDGPQSWSGILRGFPFVDVCDWWSSSHCGVWLLIAIPAETVGFVSRN